MPDAILSVGVDASGAEQGARAVRRSLEDISNSARDGMSAVDRYNTSLGAGGSAADLFAKQTATMTAGIKAVEGNLATSTRAVNDLSLKFDVVRQAAKNAVTSLQDFGRTKFTSDVTAQMNRLAEDMARAMDAGGKGAVSAARAAQKEILTLARQQADEQLAAVREAAQKRIAGAQEEYERIRELHKGAKTEIAAQERAAAQQALEQAKASAASDIATTKAANSAALNELKARTNEIIALKQRESVVQSEYERGLGAVAKAEQQLDGALTRLIATENAHAAQIASDEQRSERLLASIRRGTEAREASTAAVTAETAALRIHADTAQQAGRYTVNNGGVLAANVPAPASAKPAQPTSSATDLEQEKVDVIALTDSLDKLILRHDYESAAIARRNEALDTLHAARKAGIIDDEDEYDRLRKLITGDAAKADALSALKNQYSGVSEAQRRYTAEVERATKILDAAGASDEDRAAILREVAQAYDPAIAAQKKAMEDAERLASENDRLAASYAAVMGKIDPAVKKQNEYEQALAQVVAYHTSVGSSTEAMAADMDRVKNAMSPAAVTAAETAKENEKLAKAYEAAMAAANPATAAQQRLDKALADLRAGAAAAGKTAEQLAADEAKLTAALSPAAIAAKKEEDAFRSLVSTLDRTFGAEEKLAAQQRMLDKAMVDGVGGIRLTAQEHSALSAKLKDQHELSTRAANSTKLAAHESLNLGYQIQDFVVQVGSGQSAITAMLQQAPQAVGAVGGLSRAWALLVSPVTLVALGITTVVGAFALVGTRAIQINSQIRDLTATMRTYGTESQATAGYLRDTAKALYEGGADRSESFATSKVLASTRGLSASRGRELALLGSDITAGMGGSVDEMTKQLAAMVTDGYPAIMKLQEAIGFLSPAEAQAVRVMAEHGRQSEALGVALDALHRRFDGMRKDAMSPAATAMHELGVQFNRLVDAAATSPLVISITVAVTDAFRDVADFIANPSLEGFGKIAKIGAYAVAPGPTIIGSYIADQFFGPEDEAALRKRLEEAKSKVADLESRGWLGGPHGGYRANFQGPLEGARAVVESLEKRIDAITGKAKAAAATATPAKDQNGVSITSGADDDAARKARDAKATEYVKAQTHEVDRLSEALRGNAVDRAMATAAMRAQDEVRDKHLEGTPKENLLLLRQREARLQLEVAVNDNNRAAAAEVAGSELVARAYGQSTAAVREAEIQTKALAEVARGTIEPYEAIVTRLRALDDAQRKVQAASFDATLRQQTEDANRLAAAWGQGANAAREAALANEALAEARKRGLDPTKDAGQIRDISGGILARDAAQRSQQFAQMAEEQRRAVELANSEYAMLGQSNAERAKAVAVLLTTNELRDKGVDLTDAGTQAYIRQAGELARVNSQLQDSAQQAANISQPITTAFEDVVVGAKKAGDAGKALAEDLKRVFVRALITKPAETWLTGTLTKLMSGGVTTANDNVPKPANDPGTLDRIVGAVKGGLGSSASNAMWVQMAGSAAAVALDPQAMTGRLAPAASESGKVASISTLSATDAQPLPVAVKSASGLEAMADQIAGKYGLDASLFKAVITRESSWNPNAVNPRSGAAGLGQVMPANWKAYGIANPFDPEQNLEASARILREHLDRAGGDVSKALSTYSGHIKTSGDAYVASVMSTKGAYDRGTSAMETASRATSGVTAAQERALQAQLDAVEVQRGANDSTQTMTATQQSWVDSALGLTSVTKDASSVIEVQSRAVSHIGENAISAGDGMAQAGESATKFSTAVDDGADTFLGGIQNLLGGAGDWFSGLFGGPASQNQKVIKNADGSTSFAPATKGTGGSWLDQPIFGQQAAPSKNFVGPMPAADGLWGWNPTYGQLATGGLAVVGGIAAATQKNASTGQVIGGGLTAAGGVLLTMQNSYAKTAGAVLSVGGALLAAVSGAKDRGDKYSISHITLGANGRYALGASAQDNDGDATRFNSDANKLAKGLNDIIARLSLTPTNKDSYIDSKTKSAEQAALELLKGMQSAVPAVAYALAHETSTSLEEALGHLEFANGFDQQIAGLRSSISDLFSQFQTGVSSANTFGKTLLDVVDNAQTVFAVTKGAKLPGFATGTLSAPSGWAVVGEEGPEVVRLSGGERIWNARESAQMLAQMGQGRDDTLIHLRGSDELAAVRRALGHPGTINPETGLLGFEYGGGDHGSPGSGGSAGTGGGSSGNSSGGSGGNSGGAGTAGEGPSISRTSSTPMSQGDMQSYGGYSFGSFTADERSSTIGFGGAASYASPTSEQVTATAAAVDNVYGTSLSGWLENAALKYGLNINKSIGVDPETGLNNTQLSINAAGLAGDIASLATGIPGLGLALGALADQLGVDHISLGSIDANGRFSGATGTASTASSAIARNGGDPDRYSTNLAATETRAAADRDAATAAQKAAAEAAVQKAAQRAALQTQFDAVGLAQDRVDQLNAIVTSLGDGTFSPIGKDFDALAGDMRKAADAYVAAGQAVPDGLYGSMKQMEALGAVKKRLMDEVSGVTVETSPEQKKVEQLRGKWSNTATDLVKAFASVGIVGDELAAKLNEGFANGLRKEQGDYSDTLDVTFRKSKGEEGYDSAATLIKSYKTAVDDVNVLWPEGAARAGQMAKVTGTLTNSMSGLVKSGSITSTSLQEIISNFSDMPEVVSAASTALQKLNDATAEAVKTFNSGVDSRMYAALGNARGSGLITLDEQQRQELLKAKEDGRDTGQLVQVQAAERAAKAFELAQQDVLGSYDQQISAQQDLITNLQEGAVAAANVARQFRQAYDSLALNDNSPLSAYEKLVESRRQFEAAYTTATSSTATDTEKTAAQQLLQQLGPTVVQLANAYFANSDRTDYDRVRTVFDQLGTVPTNADLGTPEKQLQTAQDALKELQRQRAEAARIGERQYGAMTGLKDVMDQSYAVWQAALGPLKALTGTNDNTPRYSASAAVQTAWDGLSAEQQHGVARAMGWGGDIDSAFNLWLATDKTRASTFEANVSTVGGGARYAAPEDIQRAWDALSTAQQAAAVKAAGYDGGVDAGLNAWVRLGHASSFEAAVRSAAHGAGVPGFATGTMSTPPGAVWVGERGPELLWQGGGAAVAASVDSMRIYDMWLSAANDRASAGIADRGSAPQAPERFDLSPLVRQVAELTREVKELRAERNKDARRKEALDEQAIIINQTGHERTETALRRQRDRDRAA